MYPLSIHPIQYYSTCIYMCLSIPYSITVYVYACIYMSIHPIQYYKVVVGHTRRLSQDYVNMTSWDNAAYSYIRTLTLYDMWQDYYPSAPLNTDRGVMYCNLSLCLLKWGKCTDAIVAADEACNLIPTSYKVRVSHVCGMCLYST